ncbi:WxL domain-containing protein [Lacticaseibacillus parakribbianus]|uniref:WxL domain-containing protein n=1 Tax=Lacticaseibacillus parakribbianus TaxID=2970927 RepID=UPI0021CAFD10|nr:WxL domain-containing protein [Lacticaseibacillus parakribbianus]
MKKSLLVSAAALVLAATTTVAPLGVSAAGANGEPQGTTKAEFTVTAGNDGTTTPGGDEGTGDYKNLWLVQAPDLNFDKTSVASVIAGVTLPYKDGVTLAKTGDAAENQEGKLQVTDLRGTSAGWKLSASVSDFDNATATADQLSDRAAAIAAGDKLIGTLTLGLGAATADNFTQGATTADLTTNGGDVTIWNAAKTFGQGDTKATVDATTTKLAITKNANVKKGQYDATVTWTLSSTVTAE